MELKRILAKDARTAHEQAISRYGRDVLMISTQHVQGQTELIIAVDQAGPVAAPPVPATGVDRTPAVADPTAKPNQVGQASPAEPAHPFQAAMEAVLRKAPVAPPGAETQALTAAEYLADEQVESRRGKEIVNLIRDEIAALRREFQLNRHVNALNRHPQAPSHLQTLSDEMLDLGVPAALRALLLDSVKDSDSLSDALHEIAQLLRDALPNPTIPSWPGIHVVCGPSGAGKSLTCARLASHLMQQIGEVALVSCQDGRPGAWSQTQMLAARVGCTAFRVRDAEALHCLLAELPPHAAVVIDTSGSDNLQQAEWLSQLLPQAHLHLVLHAEASLSTVKRFVHDGRVGWQSLIISKLDEAAQPWPLVQLLVEGRGPSVSMMGRDDSVSSALALFDREALIEAAMRPWHLTSTTMEASSSLTRPSGWNAQHG